MTRFASAFADGFGSALGSWAAILLLAAVILLIVKAIPKGKRR